MTDAFSALFQYLRALPNSMASPEKHLLSFIFLLYGVLLRLVYADPVGVNYGTIANNLPPIRDVANFLKTQTRIDRVKLFDANPDMLRAFAGTGIAVTVTVGNGDVAALADPKAAGSWVSSNIAPFCNQTTINRIAVGNEILATSDKALIANLLPSMRSLHSALRSAGINGVEVTSPHSLGILSASDSPSTGRFRKGYDRLIFSPLLDFHNRTGSSFMVNPYPYFGFTDRTLSYALFEPNPGVRDNFTGLTYSNMFDAQLDAVYSAMNRLGYPDVKISVGETGWPSASESGQTGVNIPNAAAFNGNLVKHVNSGKGTPLMPNRKFETFIFSLFNENLKPSISEQNFGLFRPDFSPVYDVGLVKNPTAVNAGRTWCVAKPGAREEVLQNNIDYVCGQMPCAAIQQGGACFTPDDVRSHASYAMNTYYQSSERRKNSCDFASTGDVTTVDPSAGNCRYV